MDDTKHCSVCGGIGAVIMLDLDFCGMCFATISRSLQTRLSHDEFALLNRGRIQSDEVREIVRLIFGQIYGRKSADSAGSGDDRARVATRGSQ